MPAWPRRGEAGDPGSGAVVVTPAGEGFVGRFRAMASPCEVIVDTADRAEATALIERAALEATRIEQAFSRYRDGNIVHCINHACGAPVEVDPETAGLLDYAATCWDMSDGMFDITSGALRRVWTFDGGSRVPEEREVREALALVGWQRVEWHSPVLTLPPGMEIDLGGIGKEYAVDRASAIIAAATPHAALVNFGGDLMASGARREGATWAVGIDDPERTGSAALYKLEFERGGVATSGDARRFVMHHGRRLGHILNPKTGWPIEDAPRSVTVLAASCTEAGTLSTLACLQGAGARAFLEDSGARYWLA